MKPWILAAVLLLTTVVLPAPAFAGGDVYFDDSGPELIVLGNAGFYEVGFRKTNGSIAYITDKRAGSESVTLGSRHECLWGLGFPGGAPSFTGGCHYSAGSANGFSYDWSAGAQTLTLRYTPPSAAAQRVTADVTVKPSPDPWLDLQLYVRNDWGYVADWVNFPCDTAFAEAEIRQALLPVLPGVMLRPRFFAENLGYTAHYPGTPGLFADFTWLDTVRGRLAIYTLPPPGHVVPSVIGFIHDEEYRKDSTYYYHTFGARVADGGAFTTPWVRLRVGDGVLATADALRTDTGMAGFRSLRDKLGGQYGALVRSPLYKADTRQLGLRFADYEDLLRRLPAPGILHPVAFQPGGHDENYPDFLPPEETWGDTPDMAAMFRAAQAHGLFVMPYTNPTWWDDESPTLRNLPPPLTIRDLAVLDKDGNPLYENYGPHWGYVMSPFPPFVIDRLAGLARDMTGSGPDEVPGDLLFEDQIGARAWPFDHNASAPSFLSYMDGWLGHTRTPLRVPRMTELGFDRLAETVAGFHGSLLLPHVKAATTGWWGADAWRPYPLATLLARDKTLFYQHDLAPETMTVNKAILAWNAAMGYQLSYDLFKSEYGGGLESEWLDIVAAFQRWVLGEYAGERVMDYVEATREVTHTRFETCEVVTNWDEDAEAAVGTHTLAKSGVLVTCEDGRVTGGVFTRYNGSLLSPGDHFLVETRDRSGVTVRQPSGADTKLVIAKLPGRQPHTVLALDAKGDAFWTMPVAEGATGLTFLYRRNILGRTAAAYRLVSPPRTYLPYTRR